MVRSVPIRSGSASSQVMMAVVLLACFIACARAQQRGERHEKKHDEKRQVEALEERWRTAQLAGDVTTMDHMLSDDFIGISMTGQVNTKSQQLDRIRNKRLVVTKIDLNDMKVKMLDTVAIVTCQAEVEGTSEGIPMKGIYRYTRVYQHMPSGDWKITSFEATKIRPPRSAHEKNHSGALPGSQAEIMSPRFG